MNNAGISSGSKGKDSEACNGRINHIFKVNYLGTFILTELLLTILKVSSARASGETLIRYPFGFCR